MSLKAALASLCVLASLALIGCGPSKCPCDDKCPCATKTAQVLPEAESNPDGSRMYVPTRASKVERAAIKLHLSAHAASDPKASEAVAKLMRHPLALRLVENHVHALAAQDAKLQQDIQRFEASQPVTILESGPQTLGTTKLTVVMQAPTQPAPVPPKHPLLLWLWDHKDQIMAFVMQILKLFGIG